MSERVVALASQPVHLSLQQVVVQRRAFLRFQKAQLHVARVGRGAPARHAAVERAHARAGAAAVGVSLAARAL